MSPPRLLLIDNYDSFTYNLVQAFMILGAEVLVHRNDALTVEAAVALAPTHLCISPGPGTPREAGVSMRMIEAFAGRVPVLGVCLGHQCIGHVFGGTVNKADVTTDEVLAMIILGKLPGEVTEKDLAELH